MLQFHNMASWVPPFTNLIDAEKNKSGNSPPFTAFQLATIGNDGYPRTRTLIFRGFLFNDRNTNVLIATTDKRMSKYSELLHNDRFEAVFYFAGIKRQFRFRGHAKIIDDDHIPACDAPKIDDNEPDSRMLPYTVLSPSAVRSQRPDSSYTNLNELNVVDLQPPTRQEWNQEVRRQWDALSPALRSTFRKPPPGSEITDENRRVIDSIRRGVDGKKEDSGLKNFAVIAMFVDKVDVVELDRDRRYVCEREDGMWVETEICP
jgi:pyridoxamine 5'-phosphate oxidase